MLYSTLFETVNSDITATNVTLVYNVTCYRYIQIMCSACLQPSLEQIFIVAVASCAKSYRWWRPEKPGACIDKYRNKAILLWQWTDVSRNSHYSLLHNVQINTNNMDSRLCPHAQCTVHLHSQTLLSMVRITAKGCQSAGGNTDRGKAEALLWAHMTSATKPEVLHCYQRTTEPRPWKTSKESFVEFGLRTCGIWNMRADRRIDRHANCNTLHPTWGWSITWSYRCTWLEIRLKGSNMFSIMSAVVDEERTLVRVSALCSFSALTQDDIQPARNPGDLDLWPSNSSEHRAKDQTRIPQDIS